MIIKALKSDNKNVSFIVVDIELVKKFIPGLIENKEVTDEDTIKTNEQKSYITDALWLGHYLDTGHRFFDSPVFETKNQLKLSHVQYIIINNTKRSNYGRDLASLLHLIDKKSIERMINVHFCDDPRVKLISENYDSFMKNYQEIYYVKPKESESQNEVHCIIC